MKFDSTTQTIAWLRDRYQDGSLKIRPPYQRKPVWSAKQKCYLIESVLLELPIPEVYIHKTTSSELNDVFGVVDGQQRIRTVLQFIGVDSEPGEEEFSNFVLDKIPATSTWYNAQFSELTVDERRKFVGYSFAIRSLDTDSEDDVRDMFRRLNKFLTPLNPQELRRATYSGPFVEAVNRLADNSYWAEHRIVSPASIRRSLDVQFVSELLIGVIHGPKGGGATVDEYYLMYEDYEDEFPDQIRSVELFNSTLSLVQSVLPDIQGTRWSNRTDFYTLFVCMASLLKNGTFQSYQVNELRISLLDFAKRIDDYFANRDSIVGEEIMKYVTTAEKGVNDRKRRADRQVALAPIIAPYFLPRPTG